MDNKKFILNADDFGMSKAYNRAVLEGYHNGFLTSASLCSTGEAFDAAVNEILPECPNLGIGVHLNLIEGHALSGFTKTTALTNLDGDFNCGFIRLLAMSQKKCVREQIEQEFRMQIEKVLNFTKVDHLDSHVHTHGIPAIFEIVCKLAQEYNIPYVRTQFENFYLVPSIKKHLTLKYPPNILKIILLNTFTKINRKTLEKYARKTNDYILGVGYTALMDEDTLFYGLEALKHDCIAEALIHPCVFDDVSKDQHYREFLITQNRDLEDKIRRLGFEITNYKAL